MLLLEQRIASLIHKLMYVIGVAALVTLGAFWGLSSEPPAFCVTLALASFWVCIGLYAVQGLLVAVYVAIRGIRTIVEVIEP